MLELSPDAQAVLDAAYGLPLNNGQPDMAAALEALADQGETLCDPHEGKVAVVFIDHILRIAAELRGGQADG